MDKIDILKTATPQEKPDFNSLAFGRHFSDHMFVASYSSAKGGWQPGRIVPYGPLAMDPAASVLHYGQALFEGLKAFKQKNGQVVLFRPEYNWRRLSEGAERLCMQAPPKNLFLNAIERLVDIERDWVPSLPGSSLYIRPTLIGTEAFLGVRPAEEALFFVILSPVGNYYQEGLRPLKIWVESKYLRAAPGGLGATKAAANYAGSLKAAMQAKERGFAQVLWLDVTRQYIEEVGTMNLFFVFDDEILTPSLDGTILPGGVRDAVITLLKAWGIPVRERRVRLQEIHEAVANGRLLEIFGTGTAAVITPVGELGSETGSLKIGTGEMGSLAKRLYDEISGIQDGTRPDPYGWIRPVLPTPEG